MSQPSTLGGDLPALAPSPPPGTGEAPGCTLTPLSLQRIQASGVILLETILFGSLLLYFPVSIQPALELKTSGLGFKSVRSLAGCPRERASSWPQAGHWHNSA